MQSLLSVALHNDLIFTLPTQLAYRRGKCVHVIIMPVSLEQWRVAVGAWNGRLYGRQCMYAREDRGGRSKRRRSRSSCFSLAILIALLLTAKMKLAAKSTTITTANASISGTPASLRDHSLIVAVNVITTIVNSFISIIARILLIMAGDVELNPGPSKCVYYSYA